MIAFYNGRFVQKNRKQFFNVKQRYQGTGLRKCAVVYSVFAKYRYPVFRKLVESNSDNMQYCIFYDPDYETSIEKVDPGTTQYGVWRRLQNVTLFSKFEWQRGVVKLGWSKEFDVLIFLGNAYILSTWVAAIIARIRGKRVIFWTHGLYGKESYAVLVFRLFFYKIANGLLVYGNHAKNLLIQKGLPSSSLYTVYNSLDFQNQTFIRSKITVGGLLERKKRLFTSDAPVLSFVGRLTCQKKLDLIIEALDLLHKKSIPANLLFIGDGAACSTLEALVIEKGLEEYVRFYGACYDDEEIGYLLAMSAICISPGNVGLTAMHSLAFGTPVITHSTMEHQMPESEAIIPGFNGDLFLEGSAVSLAETIERWLIHNSPDTRSGVAEKCVRIIQGFYNPEYQKYVIDSAVFKSSADDIHGTDAFINGIGKEDICYQQ